MTSPIISAHLPAAALLTALFCGAAPAALAQAISTTPAVAPGGVGQEQVLALAARLDALEQRNADLERQVLDLKATAAANVQAVREQVESQPKTTLNNGRPTLTNADGAYRFALRSVVQFDAARYRVQPRTAASDLGSGTNFRRARLGAEGAAKDWSYGIWGEFGGSGGESAVLNQGWIEYGGWRPFGLDQPVRLRIGAWATPAGLEDATSNTEALFLERAAIAELVRNFATGDGRTGAGFTARGASWYVSGLLSGKVVGVPASAEFDQQSGFAARLAFAPFRGADYDLHLGASVQAILNPADTSAGPLSARAVRLQERPELRISGVRLVDTGTIPSGGLTAYGLEAGGSWRSLYAAGEWYRVEVDRRAVGPAVPAFDPSFSGWYLQGAWTITGERRAWSNAGGGFAGVRPSKPFNPKRGAWGAWEIAGRYSTIDLNDRSGVAGTAAPAGGIRGGEQSITTVGVNWYPNSVVRFLLDYQWAEVKRLNAAGADIGADVNVISLRSQFAF